MSALEQEIIEKYRLLDKEAQQRVSVELLREAREERMDALMSYPTQKR